MKMIKMTLVSSAGTSKNHENYDRKLTDGEGDSSRICATGWVTEYAYLNILN